MNQPPRPPSVPPAEASSAPHPIPYQGSKRLLAPRILSLVEDRHFRRLYEPFAGSGAISIAAAKMGLADEYLINDFSQPIADLWTAILADAAGVADEYDHLWNGQLSDPDHYRKVRDEFNTDRHAAKLLYLLARCVKNAARFNGKGEFNQSADKRRMGTRPVTMRASLLRASKLLAGRAKVSALDFREALLAATAADLVYLDPPYEGVLGRDSRYEHQLTRDDLLAGLWDLKRRAVPFLLSYDGRTGTKTYGARLPAKLADLIELRAGRSSQSTLSGRAEETIESLYVSGIEIPDDLSPELFIYPVV